MRMKKYIQGESRHQLVLFPDKLDSLVSEDSDVRVIDAFVESLDMNELGFEKPKRSNAGAPKYNPKDMLKLYIYGYSKKIRSSRKLEELTRTNVEVMWLINKLNPDFRCISDFRKDNIENLKEVFFQFNIICKNIGILSLEKISQDGTKIRAVNSKERNFTQNKLDDRIAHIKEEIEKILRDLEKSELEEAPEKLIKLDELKGRKKEYELYLKEMESKGVNQKSLTDKDSKLMKTGEEFNVCYNTQVQVDVKSHLVTNYEVTDKPADFGTMSSIVEESEKVYNEKIKVNITDNGYSDRKDMISLLENGTRPEVTPVKGKESFELETKYEENEITEEELKSENVEDIKKCLRAGKIPEVYKDSIEKIEVKEVTRTIHTDEVNDEIVDELSEEELRDKAMEEGIFIRDKKTNKVYCPGGCILRQKAQYEDGTIKYCNKLGCKNCKNPCTTARFREVSMAKNQTILVPRNSKEIANKTKEKKEEKQVDNETSKQAFDISSFKGVENREYSEDMSIEDILISMCNEDREVITTEDENILSTTENDENVLSTKLADEGDDKTKITKPKKRRIKEKVVIITYKVNKEDLKQRMSTSEHCHGTMKRADDCSYFLLKGKNKVNGEMALYYTASNIRRAINMVGAPKMLEELTKETCNSAKSMIKNKVEETLANSIAFYQKLCNNLSIV